MTEMGIFDLEKIKEATRPIGKLQANIAELEEIHNEFEEMKKKISHTLDDKAYFDQLGEISKVLRTFSRELLRTSNENVSKFLVFQDNLIKEYKEDIKEEIKGLKLNSNITKAIGLSLIESKGISRIIKKSSFIPSITISEWIALLDSLNLNTIFIKTVGNVNQRYEKYKKEKLKVELTKIPSNIAPEIIKEFENKYLSEKSLTFSEFLQNQKKQMSQEKLKARKTLIEKTQEEEKMKVLKKRQEQQQQSYQEYFQLSNKEFERRRRKKKREKLTDLTVQSKNKKKVEISDEISEKIERFKTKLENGFKDKFLYQNEEDKDPIEIIRDRKKKTREEYKKHIKKFKNVE